jgi:hypothetical protein
MGGKEVRDKEGMKDVKIRNGWRKGREDKA